MDEEDEIRVKSVSLPKNISFYLIIGALIVLLVCASVMINTAMSLNGDPRFIEYEGKKKNINNSDIIPCKKCYRHIRDGNILSIISGSFAIFFIVFLFCLYVAISCSTKNENKNSSKRKNNGKGINMIYICAFSLLTVVAIIISLIAEIFIIISIIQKTYSFFHDDTVSEVWTNSIIFIYYIFIIIFYFKQ